jgi:hypothetical protein
MQCGCEAKLFDNTTAKQRRKGDSRLGGEVNGKKGRMDGMKEERNKETKKQRNKETKKQRNRETEKQSKQGSEEEISAKTQSHHV